MTENTYPDILETFKSNEQLTIGIEEEYQLCDPATGNLVQRVEELMDAADPALKKQFSYELLLSVLELRTGINRSVGEAIEAVAGMRRKARDLAHEHGITLGISGAHPYADWRDQKFVDTPDYNWVKDQLQYIALRNITFGLHVHIGVDDPNKAVRVNNCLRRWIGPLMAISTNSPFFDGVRTGMMSTRTVQFGVFPRTGLPPRLDSFEEYERLVEKLIEAGTITKPRQIWWKLRPHLHYGTVEFRMFDVHSSLGRTAAFIALAQALVGQIIEDFECGLTIPRLYDQYLLDSYWKARRFGLDADIVEPHTGKVIPMRSEVRSLLDFAMPYAEKLGTGTWLEAVEDILANGTGAAQQLSLYDELDGDLKELQLRLIDNVEYELPDSVHSVRSNEESSTAKD